MPEVNPIKPFFKSKTVWLNVVGAAIAIFSDYDNPVQIAQFLALANLLLRFFTTGGITLSPR
jgi:hypothetical protein